MTFICCCEWSLENKRAPLEISVWDNSRIPHGFSPCQEGDFSFNPQHMVFPAPSGWSLPQQMVFLCLQTVVSYLPTTAEKSQGQKSPQKCYRIILLQMFTSVFSHVIVTFIGVLEIMEITSEEIKCQFLGRSTRIFLAVFSSIETQPDIYKTEVVANNMQGPITKACHCCFCFSKEIKKKEQGQRMFMRTLFLSATSSSSLSLSGNVTEIQSSST